MPQIERSALVGYSAEQMYRLVEAIEQYPQFLPWCAGAEVLKREHNIVEARLDASKGPFQHSFSTRNTSTLNQKIEMALLDGPFRYLQGEWGFNPLRSDACKVTLDLKFEFSSVAANAALGRVFGELMASMIDAFTNEAKRQYG